MGFWSGITGGGNESKEIVPAAEPEPSAPALINEQIPNSFNLGWYYSPNKNQYQMAKISNKDRNSHFYVIGSTGAGKSKFLEYLIMQDILNRRGVCVLDPHGDLVEDLKGYMAVGAAENDAKDILAESIILIDPTDPKYTVCFNPLEKLPGVSAAEQANELVSSFKKIWADSWGVRMEDLMRNSLIALAEAELTLVDLSRFLTDRAFRQAVLGKVRNQTAYEYFKRFDLITDRSALTWIEPIMNKVNAVFCDERIKDIFASPKSTFNFRAAMDQGQTVLIKLDKGRLKDSANLLGALLVAKIQMAAFSRSDVPERKRRPFYVYLDEFQNFASDSFATILSESRKYGLFVTMAHQTLSQISNELRALILSCTGVQAYFRLSRADASLLAKEAFEHQGGWEQWISELQNLPLRVSYVKNRIHGGIIQIGAVALDPPHETAGVEEHELQEYLEMLPFGRAYLVERSSLVLRVEERQSLVVEEVEEIPEMPRPVKRAREMPQAPRTTPEPKQQPPQNIQNIYEPILEKPEIKEPTPEEKGRTRHQYLQTLIKKMAEEKGYKAVIEEAIPDGRVDVGLLKDGRKVAVEISITTTVEHECSNVEKCLRAGYGKVIMVAQDKRHLERIRTLVTEKLAESDLEKAAFFTPEELLFHFEEEEAQTLSKEERVKGYKVKVKYQAVTHQEKNIKREAVAQVILSAFKRLNGKN